MTRTEALDLLNSLPRPATLVTFTFRDFNGQTQHGDARVEHRDDGVHLVGTFGCGKTRGDVRTALKEYLGGRELVSHQHHN